jgi:hypothetical protein
MNTNINSTNSPSLSLLDAALSYTAHGWRVMPLHSFADGTCTCENSNCNSPAKHPLLNNGVHGASTDEQIIQSWWAEADIANVGVATGDDLFVLDIDTKNDGMKTLTQLEAQHGPLPMTPTVKTGSDGRHFYFRSPAGEKIGNRTGVAQGIDVRGDNGYVVAPPSLHASGQRYEWIVPPDVPLAEPPPWLVSMLCSRTAAAQPTKADKSGGIKLTMQSAADDLTTHPGVGEGRRNAKLCKLIGVHLARGEEADDIEPLAIAWAELCSPPLTEAEVVRTLKSLAAKHQKSGVIVINNNGTTDDLDSLPLPEPPQWPTLGEAAYHGVVGDIVRTMEPETEADPVGILMSTLVVFGNVVGRVPFFPIEGDHHHVNLFGVIVGESSRGRKGTSLGRTLSLFDDVDPTWKQNCITTGLSSGEGLIWAVRDPVTAMEPVKEQSKIVSYQEVIKDQGVTDKRLLIVEPEYAQTLKVLRREGNTLSPIIRQGWDSGSLSAMTKNNFARATGTHISIVGHITRPELAKSLCDTDCFNGFANRFLWVLVRRSKLLPDGGNGLDLAALRQRITDAVAAAKQVSDMSRSDDARALWHQLYPELTAERPGLYGAVVGRGEAQTLRLSMIYALLDGSAVVEVPHLQAATAVWRYCDASARIIFGEGQAEAGDALADILLATVRREPGISRRGLHQAMGGHIPAQHMIDALARLRDRKQVRCETMPTKGRPSECWFPVVIEPATIVTTPAVEPVESSPTLVPIPTVEAAVAVPSVAAATPGSRLTLTELFEAVAGIGGVLRREGAVCVVDAQAQQITPAITAAVVEHQATLIAMLPDTSPPLVTADRRAETIVISDDEFYQELSKK